MALQTCKTRPSSPSGIRGLDSKQSVLAGEVQGIQPEHFKDKGRLSPQEIWGVKRHLNVRGEPSNHQSVVLWADVDAEPQREGTHPRSHTEQ